MKSLSIHLLELKPQQVKELIAKMRESAREVVRVPHLGPCMEMPTPRPGLYAHWKVNGNRLLAHRLMYALVYDEIENNMVVMHRCDNPPCAEPSHLRKGTIKDNNDDRHEKGRTLSGESAPGAKLTEAEMKVLLKLAAPPYSVGQRKLGRIFGIHHKSVQRAIHGEKWKHLERPATLSQSGPAEQLVQ